MKTITAGALRLLISYDWPGNIRELRHFLERTVLLSSGTTIEERDCLFDPVIFRREPQEGAGGILPDLAKLPLRQARDGFMKHYLERLYEEHNRNVSRAVRASGISRESFHRLLKKLKLNGRAREARPRPPAKGRAQAGDAGGRDPGRAPGNGNPGWEGPQPPQP